MDKFDKQAALAADVLVDGQLGDALMGELAAKWYAEGREAALAGEPFESPVLWSEAHKDGWMDAMHAEDLAVDAAQYTPRPGIDF